MWWMKKDRTPESLFFVQQLREELEAVEKARAAIRRTGHPGNPGTDSTAGNASTEARGGKDEDAFVQAHRMNLLGLALSGGGIRSATFNLGVIQRLAEHRLLHRVDYLSTVSGGGYIGSWLSAWVHRSASDIRPGVLGVEEKLREGLAHHKGPHEVRWLRRFSNYLTPRVGVLSSDTLTAVATYLRNLLLNQSILIAFGAALLVMPWSLAGLAQKLTGPGIGLLLALAGACLLAGATLAGYETRRTEAAGEATDSARGARPRWRYLTIIGSFATAALVAGILIPHPLPDLAELPLGLARPQVTASTTTLLAVVFAGLYGIGSLTGWMTSLYRNRARGHRIVDRTQSWQVLWILLASAALGGMLSAWGRAVSQEDSFLSNSLVTVALGPPAFLGALLLTVTLHLGLTGRGLREVGREFWSHHSGQQLRLIVGWLVLTGAALFGPLLLMKANEWVKALGGVAWVLTTLAGVLAGSGQATGGPGSTRTAEFVARIAPYVFVGGLLLALSYGVYRSVWWHGHEQQGLPASPHEAICHRLTVAERTPVYDFSTRVESESTTGRGVTSATGRLYDGAVAEECDVGEYIEDSANLIAGEVRFLGMLLLLLFSISAGLSRRVDINVFGLHMFYRNRIERCYMGASNTRRRPHPATGLDPTDSPRLDALVMGGDSYLAQRPFPIVNTALNITSARNLAWQERKAASFTFTPMFSGYEIEEADEERTPGYQRTADYVKKDKKWISLSLPITISGAAASPNAGYHTSAATAFLMTVFNVRLGWWLQNPRYAAQWQKPGPKYALARLLQELAGWTTDEAKYVYLSDGGHFENLGIYELARRRCRYIIACDAGCDPDYGFEDLGNAVRKCQIDLGVNISIDPRAIRPPPDSRHSTFHCAVGRINYPDGPPGFLLYLKASLTGNEPADIMQYAGQNPDFPHQTTADQWYSESQFESYRKLGFHILDEVLSASVEKPGTLRDGATVDLEEMFNALTERWYRPSPHVEASFARHSKALEEIFERMRKDEHLHFLDEQIYPEWWYLAGAGRDGRPERVPTMLPGKPEEVRAGFYLCNSLIQLMESVYLDLNLEEQYGHPDNRGWMNLFRHWSWAGMFRVTWAISASTYGARFQRFCRRRLDLEVGQVVCREEFSIEDMSSAQAALNFVEKDHVCHAVKALIDRLGEDLRIVQISLAVRNPFDNVDRIRFGFPFAFALMDLSAGKRELVYYRVRDHLRGMGLGRKGLAVLLDRYAPHYSPDTVGQQQQERVKQLIPEVDYAALARLWNSVLKAAEERGGRSLDRVV